MTTGVFGSGQLPIEEKEALVEALRGAVDELRAFCVSRDVDLERITRLRKFEWIEALKHVTDMLMMSDDETQSFMAKAAAVDRLFKAILPDPRANDVTQHPKAALPRSR